MCGRHLDVFQRQIQHAQDGNAASYSQLFRPSDWSGDPQPIPVGATLSDVRLGPDPQGKPGRDPDLAAFRFDGKVYFGSAEQVIQNSKVVEPSTREGKR